MHKLLSLLVFFSFTQPVFCQNWDSIALAKADTSRFTVNKAGGWMLYNSYVAPKGPDSVLCQLIVKHARDIDWSREQYVGTIKGAACMPGQARACLFYLLKDTYAFNIKENGDCFLRLAGGSLPPGDPVVVPVEVRFAKK